MGCPVPTSVSCTILSAPAEHSRALSCDLQWAGHQSLHISSSPYPPESTYASASKTSAPWPPYVFIRSPLWGFHRRTVLSLPEVRQYLPLSDRKRIMGVLLGLGNAIKITQLLNLTDLTGPSWADSSKASCTGRPSTMPDHAQYPGQRALRNLHSELASRRFRAATCSIYFIIGK